ncbi:MAG: signal peptidase II [Planctomycetes bacterium]|nr:signal peptidase II [Planctomycetota bacterium]
MTRWLVFVLLAAVTAGADLWSKDVVLRKVPPNQERVVIPGYFAFGHIYNEGIVFGKFQDMKGLWLVVSVVAVPVILAIFASVKNPRWILTVSLALILGGTIGNLYDRAKFGKVRDFIKFSYTAGKVEHPWPLFNLADAYICAGVLLLSAEMVFFDEKKKKKLQEEKAARAAAIAAPAAAPTEPMAKAATPGPAAPTEPMAKADPAPPPAAADPQAPEGGGT